MSYTLLRECSIVLFYKDKGYRFDALSDVGFSQTYSRKTGTRKTLHSKAAKPNTIVSSKNVANFNMSVVGTDTFMEAVFFDLLGMEYLGHYKYRYQSYNNISPETCEIYIINNNEIFRASPAVIESIDIPLAIQSSGTMTVAFSAGNIERVTDLPLASGLNTQGAVLKPTPVQFKYNNLVNSSIINAGVSLKQEVRWREDKSLHDIGSIYSHKHPILVDTSISATVTTHLRANNRTDSKPEIRDVELYQACTYIHFKDALVTKRIEPEDIFLEAYDVALTENTDVIVEYGGLIS